MSNISNLCLCVKMNKTNKQKFFSDDDGDDNLNKLQSGNNGRPLFWTTILTLIVIDDYHYRFCLIRNSCNFFFVMIIPWKEY